MRESRARRGVREDRGFSPCARRQLTTNPPTLKSLRPDRSQDPAPIAIERRSPALSATRRTPPVPRPPWRRHQGSHEPESFRPCVRARPRNPRSAWVACRNRHKTDEGLQPLTENPLPNQSQAPTTPESCHPERSREPALSGDRPPRRTIIVDWGSAVAFASAHPLENAASRLQETQPKRQEPWRKRRFSVVILRRTYSTNARSNTA